MKTGSGVDNVVAEATTKTTKILTNSAAIADFVLGDASLRITITRADGERIEAQLSSHTVQAFADFLREREDRKKALDELTRYSEEIGLYDLEEK